MATHPIYIKINDLETIAGQIRAFKDSLLEAVNAQGGVTQIAKRTGIPQPSLSRFFNTDAMPQRSTLLKIAKALNLSAIPVNLDGPITSDTAPLLLDQLNETLDFEDS